MNSEQFIAQAKTLVTNYYNSKKDQTDSYTMSVEDTYVVWFNFTLGNMKALLSTVVSDGMYYEVTYDVQQNQIYFDAYKKWEHITYVFTNQEETNEE